MNATVSSDAQLIQECLNGNRELFACVVRKYQSLVCAITYNLTGDLHQSEELAQETFVTAWNNLGRIREPDKLRSWLCGIARNLGREWLRTHTRRKELSLPKEGEFFPEVCGEPTPFETILSQEEESLLWKAIESIPETFREPLILFYRQQQSIEEVAEALELSPDAVKQRLARGRNMLKDRVAAFVESALSKTGPRNTFAVAVLAALPAALPQAAAAGLAMTSAKGSTAAKLAASLAASGALLGMLLGFLGGALGWTIGYRSLKSEPEKKYYLKMGLWSFLYILGYFALLMGSIDIVRAWWYPKPLRLPQQILLPLVCGLTVFFNVILMLLLKRWNARLRDIQKEQGTYIDPQEAFKKYWLRPVSRGKIWGTYAALTFSTVAWIVPLAILSGDWMALLMVTLPAAAIFLASVRSALIRNPHHLPVLQWMVCALFLVDITVINLRWDLWSPAVFQGIPLWLIDFLAMGIFGLIFHSLWQMRKRIRELEQTTNV